MHGPVTRPSLTLLVLSLCALATVGCARETFPPAAPLSPYAPYPPPQWMQAQPPAYAWAPNAAPGYPPPPAALRNVPDEFVPPPPPPAFEPPSRPPPAFESPSRPPHRGPAHQVPLISSTNIPNGEACLQMLPSLGIEYRPLDEERGVLTPIEVLGPIGGIRYHAGAGLPFICDCRLAVALAWASPILRQAGVTDLRYSGVYVYRMSRVGRLSLHAYGLAIDLHEFTLAGTRLKVAHDYEAGMDDPCASSAPTLNQVACRLKRLGLFKELLTPDYNADHHDHFHLGIAPLDSGSNQLARRTD